METFLIACLAGVLIGLLVGLVPAIGPFIAMLLLFPGLLHLDAMSIIAFYTCLLMAANFSGSVTGIMFGVPGESNSVISSQLGFRYNQRSFASFALGLTAFGSVATALTTIMFLLVFLQVMSDQTWVYSTYTQILIFGMIYVLMALSKNGIMMILIGTSLAALGYSDWFGETTMLGMPFLAEGLGMLPVMAALIVIPTLATALWQLDDQKPPKSSNKMSVVYIIARTWRAKFAWTRSVFCGVIMGLIPGVGTVIVSNVSYVIEKCFSFGPKARLLAAESSNNAAAVSSLVPLLCFGIPITASEAVLIHLLMEKHTLINLAWFEQPIWLDASRISWIYGAMIISSIISALFCWQLIQCVAHWVIQHKKTVFASVIMIMIMMIIWQGWQDLRLTLDIATVIILLPVGFWLRTKKSYNFLLLCFLLYDHSSQSVLNFVNLL